MTLDHLDAAGIATLGLGGIILGFFALANATLVILPALAITLTGCGFLAWGLALLHEAISP